MEVFLCHHLNKSPHLVHCQAKNIWLDKLFRPQWNMSRDVIKQYQARLLPIEQCSIANKN